MYYPLTTALGGFPCRPKKPEMTEESGREWAEPEPLQWPCDGGGKARIGAPHLRHGFYASEASDDDFVPHDILENKGS